jgi:hypothetical protein
MRRRQCPDIAIAAALSPPPKQLHCCALPFFVWKWGTFQQISKQEVISIEEFNHWHSNPLSTIVSTPNQEKPTHTAQVYNKKNK